MSRDLRLQVVLNAAGNATRHLKQLRQGSGQTAQALKAARDQLRQVEAAGRDLNSFRQMRAELRANARALTDTVAKQQQYSAVLDKQRTEHNNIKGALAASRREFQQLSEAMINGRGEGREFTRRLEQSRLSLANQEKAFAASSKRIKTYKDRLRHAGTNIDQLNKQKASLGQRLDAQRQKLQAAGVDTDRAGQSARRLANDTARLNAEYATQRSRMDAIAKRQRQIQELNQRHGTQMKQLAMAGGTGYAMQAAGRRAGTHLARLLSPGVGFGEVMSELQAVAQLERESPAMRALRAQAREYGASTHFSAGEVGAGQVFLARAGFTPEAIRASMADMLDLAMASGADLARTADIASNISGAFKLDPEVEGNIRRVADVLAATTASTNVNLEMLGETMKYLGQAEGLDVSLEQAAAMAGLLGNIGIQGSQAGTTLRAMMSRLAAPMGQATQAMEQLGLSATDSDGNLRDILDVLNDVAWATEAMGNAERAGYLKQIFGEQAGSGMAELVGQQGSGALADLVKQLRAAEGTTARMAQVRGDNLGGDLKGLRSAWEEIGISLSEINDQPLRDLTRWITDHIRALGQWANANPELVATLSKVAGATVGLLTVMGGLTVALVTILGPMLMLRFLLARLGIGLLPLAGKGFRLLATTAGGAAGGFARLGGAAKSATPAITAAWSAASPRAAGAGILATTKALFTGFVPAITKAGLAIKAFAGSALSALYAVPVALAKGGIVFMLMMAKLKFAITGTTAAVWAFVKAKGALGTTMFLLTGAAKGLWAVLLGLLAPLRVALHALLFLGRAALFTPIGLAITAIAAGALLILRYWRPITAFFKGVWEGFREGLAPLGEMFSGTFAALGAALSPLKPVWDWIASTMASAWKWISALVGPLESTTQELNNATESGRAFGEWLASLIVMGAEIGKNIILGIIRGIGSMVGALKDAVSGVADSTIGWFKGVLGIHSPSRVFARLGDDTLAGYRAGIDRGEQPTVRQMAGLGKRLGQAGAGIALAGALSLPAVADTRIDTRPPMGARAPVTIQGDTIHITINAAPGMDTEAIGREVARQLRQHEHERAARRRAALYDRE